jgi:hypothetical protein
LHRHCPIPFRQHVPVQITEIAWILKRVNLSAAVFELLIGTCDAGKQKRRMSGRLGGVDDVSASEDTRLVL